MGDEKSRTIVGDVIEKLGESGCEGDAVGRCAFGRYAMDLGGLIWDGESVGANNVVTVEVQ